jgi:hypothetical protein
MVRSNFGGESCLMGIARRAGNKGSVSVGMVLSHRCVSSLAVWEDRLYQTSPFFMRTK